MPNKKQTSKKKLSKKQRAPTPKKARQGWDDPVIRAKRIAGIRAAFARRAKSGTAPKKKAQAVSTVAASPLAAEMAEKLTPPVATV